MEGAPGAQGKEVAKVPWLGPAPGSLEGRSEGWAQSRVQNSKVALLAEAPEGASGGEKQQGVLIPHEEDLAQSWLGGSAWAEGWH